MDAGALFLVRSALLVLATAVYQYSSSSPNLKAAARAGDSKDQDSAKEPYNEEGKASSNGHGRDSHNVTKDSKGIRVAKTSFGESVTKTDEVHDSPNSFMSRQGRAKQWRMRIIWTLTFLDIATRAINFAPAQFSAFTLQYLCPSSHSASNPFDFHISPTYLFLVFLTLSGGLLRHACYMALGAMFTFAHTTRSDHILVEWGPYAHARHAGYSALVLAYGGMVGLIWIKDGWLRECTSGLSSSLTGAANTIRGFDVLSVPGIIALVTRTSAVIFSAWSISVAFALIKRTSREDATLKRRFGERWEAYRRRVPWKFVPHVL